MSHPVLLLKTCHYIIKISSIQERDICYLFIQNYIRKQNTALYVTCVNVYLPFFNFQAVQVYLCLPENIIHKNYWFTPIPDTSFVSNSRMSPDYLEMCSRIKTISLYSNGIEIYRVLFQKSTRWCWIWSKIH